MAGIVLAVSAGDPSGVGPEVIRAALAQRPRGVRLVLFGDESLVGTSVPRLPEAGRTAYPVALVPVSRLAERDRKPGRPTRAGGRAQLAYLEAAARAVETGLVDALVTAPVSKEAITRSGPPFLGHTEWLAARAGVRPDDVAMMFTGGGLTTVLATTHIPLAEVSRALSVRRIVRAAELCAVYMRRVVGVPRPRLLVAALNPHSGEGGLLGTEETQIVAPAVREASKRLRPSCTVEGPISADAAFRQAQGDRRTAVVALYHDQATIPVKLVAFSLSANVTVGLPYLRTSVDHGVAYDLAGTGRADEGGLLAAVRLAAAGARQTRKIPWTPGQAWIYSDAP